MELKTSSQITDIRQLLKDKYKAVFVATGAQTEKKLDIPGKELGGVIDALQLLRDRALDKAESFDGRQLVVIGGGNAAVDAARSALRLGAKNVTILYRRSREDMPAYAEEIEEAINEGIELHTLAIPKRIVGNGNVTGVEIVRARLGAADESGRRKPIPIEKTETILKCDVIIVAIGQIPSTDLLTWPDGPQILPRGTVKVDRLTMATSTTGVFAAGDCVSGGSTVIEAIAGGQRAAVNIDKFLGGSGRLPADTGFAFAKPSEEELAVTATRQVEKMMPAQQRKLNFHEVVLGLEKEQAIREAKRCLRCDLED
ncbi:MAG: hypothetical protein A2173_05290 [Planctomycetes bacterium RBG_13_44_8b]|nr:MAG: hypothetical protein A2173_05290 [Planctomycetes bacterium RBG_13_44_8b]